MEDVRGMIGEGLGQIVGTYMVPRKLGQFLSWSMARYGLWSDESLTSDHPLDVQELFPGVSSHPYKEP